MYRSSAALPVLAVGFNRRFSPAVRKIKDALGVHAPAAITYRVNAGLIPADNWIQDRETGGGRIIGEVCHFVDTCMFLAGALPVSVFAQPVKAGRRDIPEEDNVNILITFANGSTAAINYFAYGNRNMPKEYIEVFSDNFAARLDNFSGLSVFRGNRKQRFKYAGQDKGHGEELKSFIHAVESGPPPVPPEELFSSTRVTFKILESLRHNTVVRV